MPLILAAVLIALTAGLPSSCIGCSFAGRNLAVADLSFVAYVGSDFSRANLRDADLSNADLRGLRLCTREVEDDRVACADLRGAQLGGADLRGTQICASEGRRECSPLDAKTLRRASHSDLHGAMLP